MTKSKRRLTTFLKEKNFPKIMSHFKGSCDCTAPFRFLLFTQIIAFSYHSPNILFRYTIVQNHRIPMFFVHMISRDYGIICLPPKITPFRVAFHIDPYMAIPLKYPCKYTFVCTDSHTGPVRIMKWIILIYIRKSKTVPNRFLSGSHISNLPVNRAVSILLPAL